MRSQPNSASSSRKGRELRETPARGLGRIPDHGVALIITLLLLFLLSVIGLAAVMSSSSDLLINGYYKNYRGSFYAADSGLNVARQNMVNWFNNQANAPGSWPATQTGANTWGTNAITSILANVNGLTGSLTGYSTDSQNSVPANFKITSVSFTLPQNPTENGTGTQWTYTYNYTLVSQGSSQGSEMAQISESGALNVTLNQGSGQTTTNVSFSAFGAFIDSFAACQGPLVQGYLTGPMYANGEWNFGSGSPGYTFTDPVSQTDAQFSYYPSNGGCTQSSQVPYGSIKPVFQSGYALGVTPITLPPNDFSQQWAVLDGKGCGEGTNICGNLSSPAPPLPAPQDFVNHNMQNVSQQPYASGSPLTAATSGVYLPYTCSGSTCSLNANAGGIYVEASNSNVSTTVTLSTTNGAGGSSNPSGQVFSIAQASGPTTGTPVVTQQGSTTCTYSSHRNKTTCTANFQQVTTTTTPTTFTTVTVDPVAPSTTVSAYTQNANTTTTATASSSCSVSGSGGCTPPTPTSFSGGNQSNSTSDTATTTLNLSGVPSDQLNSPPNPATMIYIDGNVSISGPSSGAAVQNNAMVTLAANGNITQTGNILYATEPVTTSANQVISGSNPACCNGDPADTLIPQYQNMNQVLGIFTANGNFILSPTVSGSNIETDASVAMISQAGSTNSNIGHIETGNSVGTWTNIGGRMENRAYGVNMNSSNVYYDRRFNSRSNFAPPWFPSTIVSSSVITSTITATSSASPPSRTSWQYAAGAQ